MREKIEKLKKKNKQSKEKILERKKKKIKEKQENCHCDSPLHCECFNDSPDSVEFILVELGKRQCKSGVWNKDYKMYRIRDYVSTLKKHNIRTVHDIINTKEDISELILVGKDVKEYCGML